MLRVRKEGKLKTRGSKDKYSKYLSKDVQRREIIGTKIDEAIVISMAR